MFHLIASLILLYVAFRLIVPLSLGRKAGTAVFVALLLVSQQHAIIRWFFGSMSAVELPQAVLLFLGWLFAAFLLLAVFLLLTDLAVLLFWLAQRAGLPVSLPFSPARRAALLLALCLILSAVGVRQAMREPELRTVEVTLDRLSPALDGLSLVQITDPHVSALLRGPRMRAIVNQVLDLDPDLILLTGDLVDGTPADRAADVASLADLRARFGVFACVGNHEYYSNYAAWVKAFADLELTVLNNSHTVLSVRGEPLIIAGLTDPASSRFGLPGPDIKAALAGVSGDAPVILLAHQPRAALENAQAGVDLQLSGHTHGGQILGLDLLVKHFNNGFLSGWYTLDSGRSAPARMQLYVSNGAGLWAGFPVRLGVPAEVTRIVLRSAPRKGGAENHPELSSER